MLESKFLKQTDVGTGVLVTISGVKQYNVAMQGADPEMKWCLEFREIEKPLVLNVTNLRLLESIFGSDNTDDWLNKQVVLYSDPSVMYAGKVVGGTRVRASKRPQPVVNTPVRQPQPAPQPQMDPVPSNDEIPFDPARSESGH